MYQANEAGFLKECSLPDEFAPVLEHLQADQCQLYLCGKAVVHADQSRRTPTSAPADVVFVDYQDPASLALSQMERDGGAHYACAQDYDIGRTSAVCVHAAPALNLPFFQSRNACCAALWPGAPVTPPPGCVPAPHRYSPSIGVRYCDHPATGRMKNNCSSRRSP